MKSYELTYLISSDISEEEAKDLQTKITSLIQEQGGVLVQESPFLKKNLAYSVKEQSRAFLATLVFQALPDKLSALEKILKEESKILRYLVLTKLPPGRIKPSRLLKKPKPEAPKKEKKVELKEIEKKLDEILE